MTRPQDHRTARKPDHRRPRTRLGRHPGHPPRRARCRDRDRGRVQPEGTPEGYQLRGHHWPERWVLGGQDQPRLPSCSSPGSCWRPGAARWWRSCCTKPPTPWRPGAASRTPVPPATATTTSGSSPWRPSWACASPDVPDKITGWSHCTLHGQPAYDAWAEVTAGIDAARLPFLIDLARPGRPGRGTETAARTRATTARASPPSGAGGGSRSSAPASPSRAASSSPPSRSRTARSCAAYVTPRSNYPGTTRVPR